MRGMDVQRLVTVGVGAPTIDEVVAVARHGAGVALTDEAIDEIERTRTGVRLETATAYAALLSAHITPVVPEHGSLGCSGDLAPLAHCALALMGEGEVRDAAGELRDAATTLADAGIEPVELAE